VENTKNALNPVKFNEWANSKKEHAQKLQRRALDYGNQLFQNGDLDPYVGVLSRLHAYNFYNLLLILQQYPEASCLAAFQEWKKQCSEPNMQVLKKEQIGKGIELIAPFTEPPRNVNRALFWVGVKQFDVSQTHICYECPQSIYGTDTQCRRYLEGALRSVLSQKNYCVVKRKTNDFTSLDDYSSGFRRGKNIICNPDSSLADQIIWLLRNLIEISEPERIVGPQYKDLFVSLVISCLLRIWNMTEHDYLVQDSELIRSIPKNMQPLFLDQLQVFVRNFTELVHCAYLEQRRNAKEETAY